MSSERIEPLGPLGPGAPGRALLVLDRATGMRVAGKRLTLPEGVGDDLVRREAMALGGTHQTINPVLEVVADGDAVWVLSQAIPGRSLRAEVHQRGALGPAAAAQIGLAVLAALSYAHEHGVVHGNLHPGNILIATDNRVWVGDFGIPALADQTIGRMPGYTAPDSPSPAADLWSLGAVLYTAALGRPPFVRATPAATAEAVREGIAIEATDPFSELLRDLLAVDPSRRPDAPAVHTALQNVLQAPAGDVPTMVVGGATQVLGGGTAVLPAGTATPPGGTLILPGPAVPGDPPVGPAPREPARARMPRIRTQVLLPALAGAAALGAAAALFVPPDVLPRPSADASTVAAPSGSPSARADLDVGPFTRTPSVCDLVPDAVVAELVPFAEDPTTYENGDFRSCSWQSDYRVPEVKRARLSVILNVYREQRLAEGTFEIAKQVEGKLSQDLREVPDLGHDAFTYKRISRSPLRQYQVAYMFRLTNLQATVEYDRAVSVDPDGSIELGAEKIARAILDALLKKAD